MHSSSDGGVWSRANLKEFFQENILCTKWHTEEDRGSNEHLLSMKRFIYFISFLAKKINHLRIYLVY